MKYLSIVLLLVLSACGNGQSSQNKGSLDGSFIPNPQYCACPCVNADACSALNWMGYYSQITCISQSGQTFSAGHVMVCQHAI